MRLRRDEVFDLKSDWFCGAYEQKSVDSGLKLVESTTRQRLVFVESLRLSLKGSSSGEDSISELIAATEKFQKTLNFVSAIGLQEKRLLASSILII